MKQKIAIITGGGSGIGKATVKAFLDLGYKVVATDLNEAGLKKTADEFVQYKDSLTVEQSDVTKFDSVAALVRKVIDKFGKVDALINAAGVFRGGMLHESTEDDYNFLFNVNVKGIINTTKAVIPEMLRNESGAIVNIASVSGIGGDYNMPLYCASKGAVVSLTQATALDYRECGVRINCVSPSATATPMFLTGTNETVMNAFINAFPDHKIGLPEQVADAIAFLASDRATHICGHNLPVDGGLTSWNGQPKQDKSQG